jgi:hypothetical protein
VGLSRVETFAEKDLLSWLVKNKVKKKTHSLAGKNLVFDFEFFLDFLCFFGG